MQALRSMQRSNHSRDAQLTRNDGSMTCTAALVGDDTNSPFQQGVPIRIGNVGNEDVTLLYLLGIRQRLNNGNFPANDMLTNRLACKQRGCRLRCDRVFL
jgi:hypothetical protein